MPSSFPPTSLPPTRTHTNGTTSAENSPLQSPSVQRVLLLLDVQVGVLSDPPRGVPNARQVRQNILTILTRARESVPPPTIIHVRNSDETDERGSPGWQLLYDPLPGEHVIDKTKNNAFAGTPLNDLVSTDAELVVVGMQSDFCIRATCSAALGRGNSVILVRGAHATYDGLELYSTGQHMRSTVQMRTPAKAIECDIEEELEEAGVGLWEMKDLDVLFPGGG